MATLVSSTPVVMTAPVATATSPGNTAYSKAFRILGTFQILLGTLSIFTWSYALAFAISGYYYDIFAFISSGIWCGIFFLVAGILAAVSSVEPNNCKIVSGLVMSIFAAIFAATMFGIEITAAFLMPGLRRRIYYYSYSSYSSYSCTPYYKSSYYKSSIYIPTCSSPYRSSRYISGVYIPSKYISCYTPYNALNLSHSRYSTDGMSTLHGFMAFFAFAELIVAITHSVYCCKYKSLQSTTPATTVQYTTTYQQPITHQMPVTSIGQPGMAITTTYPAVQTVPYQNNQTPIYSNQANMMMSQPATSMSSPITMAPTGMSSPGMTSPTALSPPNYTESNQVSDNKQY
uniref:Uncharacterized protein n=1 Tax=Ciona savignyi TaxID=51511 RepID=H2YPP6_CIOSA